MKFWFARTWPCGYNLFHKSCAEGLSKTEFQALTYISGTYSLGDWLSSVHNKGKNHTEDVLSDHKTSERLASAVRELSVCTHQSPEWTGSQNVLRASGFNNRLLSCTSSRPRKHWTNPFAFQRRTPGCCKWSVTFLKPHLQFTAHAWLACFNGF